MFSVTGRANISAPISPRSAARDAIIFSGGIGENAPLVREKICERMEWCGLSLDKNKNDAAIGAEGPISPVSARIHAYVIPSDEEAIIARETARLFRRETN